MSLEQRLTEKLRPHADRVAEGRHNEFDFLPAALLHGLEHGKHMSEALNTQRALVVDRFTAIELQLNEAVKTQIENKGQISEALDTQRALVVDRFTAIELQLNEGAKTQIENKGQISEALNTQRALVVDRFTAIELQLNEAAKTQIENKGQISEALNTQSALVVDRFTAIDLQLHEGAKQQNENKALVSEFAVSVQRRLDRTASDFNKQIGKLTDALDDQTEHSRKRHQASQTILYLCLICAVLTLVAAVALLIKR